MHYMFQWLIWWFTAASAISYYSNSHSVVSWAAWKQLRHINFCARLHAMEANLLQAEQFLQEQLDTELEYDGSDMVASWRTFGLERNISCDESLNLIRREAYNEQEPNLPNWVPNLTQN